MIGNNTISLNEYPNLTLVFYTIIQFTTLFLRIRQRQQEAGVAGLPVFCSVSEVCIIRSENSLSTLVVNTSSISSLKVNYINFCLQQQWSSQEHTQPPFLSSQPLQGTDTMCS